jgi:enoyl-CoA hydratase/carnithine racemase
MLRQHHVRREDLRSYLRGYDPDKPVAAPEEWAKTESAGFEAGTLIFCLDAATGQPGLSSFGKKEADAADSFRVRDLCIVVGKENGRALVVSITASAYELRFLEVLMLEKARKAILDAKEFCYVSARPAKPLPEAAIKEVEQLGNVYAQGGSRRSLAGESSGPMEPAVALLSALGVRLSAPSGKQVWDIGSICHMLFAVDGRQQEDKNRTLLKACFTPMAGSFSTTKPVADSAVASETKVDIPVTEASNFAFEAKAAPRQAEAQTPASGLGKAVQSKEIHADATEGFDYSLFGQLTEPPPEAGSREDKAAGAAAPIAQPQTPAVESDKDKQDASGQTLFGLLTNQAGQNALPGSIQSANQSSAEGKKGDPAQTSGDPTETYKHLAEALSGLMDADEEAQPEINKSEATDSKADAAERLPGSIPARNKERASEGDGSTHPSAEALRAQSDKSPSEQKSEQASNRSLAATTGDHEPIVTAKGHGATSRSSDTATGDNISALRPTPSTTPGIGEASESSMRTTPTGFQEPQAVMNEMASLMSKLEQQVSKASKKLASRAEEIEHRLNRRTEGLLEEASQDDKNTEASILVLCDSLTKQFEQLSEELRLRISDAAAAGREAIKVLQGEGQTKLEETRSTDHDSLLNACNEFRAQTQTLAKSSDEELRKLVKEHVEEVDGLIQTTLRSLGTIAGDFESKLNQRFTRFAERMAEESSAVINSIERNVHSMEEEIDGSWERASEKLKSSESDFEQTIEHTLSATGLSTAQAARILLVEQFLPKLKERKEIVVGMATEMASAFSEQSLSQTRSQLSGLDSSLASARQQLHTLAEECLSRIDSVGRQQQAGLEDLFKDASGFMERSTAEVLSMVDKTEQQIHDVEGVCKKLAETSSLDTDPHLSDERNAAFGKVQNLKGQVKAELDRTLEASCAQLEQLGQSVQSHLNTRRIEQTQLVREASETGLIRIRESIQEAFNAIQAAREKYME